MADAVICSDERRRKAVPIFLVRPADDWPDGAHEAARLQQFKGELGQFCVFDGGVLIGGGQDVPPLALGTAAMKLPSGDYRVEAMPDGLDQRHALLGFAMGAYRFTKYRSGEAAPVLVSDDDGLADSVNREAAAIWLGRDLINTPAEEMGPLELEEAARTLAAGADATFSVHKGASFAEAFPLIHAVGRAASAEPRLIELRWRGGDAHRLALIGKGVCFDSGGLNIKPGSAMALMKKDMGGAATALALGKRIMDEGLPIDLRLLVPAVENAIAGNAFRPGDVFRARDGQTVEISNTDAEGRLILADAMALAAEEKPDRILTLATLTGAARVALGPDLPPIYATDEAFRDRVLRAGDAVGDPLWPMPFWQRYESYLESDIADVNHAATTPFAGSITAALFLKRFAADLSFTHIDTFAWTPNALPGRPKGGDPLTVRALFKALADEFSPIAD